MCSEEGSDQLTMTQSPSWSASLGFPVEQSKNHSHSPDLPLVMMGGISASREGGKWQSQPALL